LANVHGRLGFNPASFIISAAYSFTGIAGQSLYPLNGVLALLFYTWLLKKILTNTGLPYNFFILVLAILSLRITLINISSPSSDLLSGILLFYCGLRTYELIRSGKNTFGDYLPVLIISCFSLTAKLSAIPSLLIIPFICFIIIKRGNGLTVTVKLLSLYCLLLLPWLGRNFVLSGYLLYPIPGTNFFHTDWAVPHNVIQLDYLFSKYGPRTVTVDFFTMQKMNTLQLIKTWFNYMSTDSPSSLLLTLAAFFSAAAWPLFRFLKKNIPINPFILWCIYYICVCVWFINSPEHRFGLPYLLLAGSLPFLTLADISPLKWTIPIIVSFVLLSYCCIHYSIAPLKKKEMYSFSIKDCWLRPMRDLRYSRANDLSTFPSANLANGVKLYYADSKHECLNADGPCMNWRYGMIEMRGEKVDNGFRNTKDEVKKYYPFVNPQ